jgi:prepilin-type N-terminal cleavage/methylation domain-containing protein
MARLAKTPRNQAGFTLLEILVVLVIMGFLIAMVAPRLANISGGAVDTICDTNQNRMVSYLSTYFEKTNRFPDNLTNLVEETADATYQIPAISDDDPSNGAETLAQEFNNRNHFRIHYLNDAEAAELKSMGIVNVFNLNAYDAYDATGAAIKSGYDNTATGPNDVLLATSVTKAPKMEAMSIPTDTATTPFAVAMVAMGADSSGSFTGNTHTDERGWGEPEFFGRIVLGTGPECGLIKSGIIANAAHCPGGIQNTDNVTYNDYNVVLPRLAATVARTDYADGITDNDTATDGIQVTALSYESDNEPAASYDYSAADNTYKLRSFTISEAQETWQYHTQCPEGHMYPEDDGEFWGINMNAGTTID